MGEGRQRQTDKRDREMEKHRGREMERESEAHRDRETHRDRQREVSSELLNAMISVEF